MSAGAVRSAGAPRKSWERKIGYDNNGDGDVLDPGDDLQVDDDFSTNVITLSYDNNGNLTDDGMLKFVYDAWNRLAQATRRVDAETVIGTYRYLGNTWRASKAVTNCGPEAVANDGGNTTVKCYYSQKWQILEMRNGSNQATRQFVYGTQYVDEPLLMDVNSDPATDHYCDPDVDSGDRRYAYAQDRNWNVVALLETDDGVGTAGAVAEQYAYTPYGEFLVLKGVGPSGNLGNALVAPSTGNLLTHQALVFGVEIVVYQNRHRQYGVALQRFTQRDPLGYADGHDSLLALRANPVSRRDPLGLVVDPDDVCDSAPLPGDGETVCDGEGGIVACIDRCKMPGICTPYRSPSGYRPSDPCPGPPPPLPPNPGCFAAAHFCNDVAAHCACEHEKTHITHLGEHRPGCCVGVQKGHPPVMSDPLDNYCMGAYSDMIANRESAQCFRSHGGGTECASKKAAEDDAAAAAAEASFWANCGGWSL